MDETSVSRSFQNRLENSGEDGTLHWDMMKDYIFYPFSLSKQMNRFGKWSKKHLGNTVGKAMPICLADLLIFLRCRYMAWRSMEIYRIRYV